MLACGSVMDEAAKNAIKQAMWVPLKSMIKRDFETALKAVDLGKAESLTERGTGIVENQWLRNAKTRLAAAVKKERARQAAEAKKRAAARKKNAAANKAALKSSKCSWWHYPSIGACGLVFSGTQTCGTGPKMSANATCRRLAKKGNKCACGSK